MNPSVYDTTHDSSLAVADLHECPRCLGEGGDDDRSCSKCGGTGYDATVVFDGPSHAVVQLPHGTYRIAHEPLLSGTGHSLMAVGTGTAVDLNGRWDDVKVLRRGGPVRPEVVEALMLAVFAFRDRAATKLAGAA